VSSLLWFAIALTRAWTAAYTKGLAADLRAERREEIDCDLWEHQRLADLQREPVTGTAIEILLRLILGVPSDLTWCLEARASTIRRTSVNDSTTMRVGLLVLAIPLLVMAANGIGMLLGGGDFDSRQDQLMYGFGTATAALAAIGGLWLCASQPKTGLVLLVAGVVTICALYYWMLFVTVPIGLVIVAFALRRSGLVAWPPGQKPSATGAA
jgi:hypothetical protein